ncbi:MAG: hypothetical protein IPJ65_15115 [Archangiaceae bacterium]|nr:hypothetical protein [Archangiaceae bacterium]
MSALLEREGKAVGSPLLSGLRAAGPVPAAVETFDRLFGGPELGCDDFEHSMHAGAQLDVWRLTYYFDVARRGDRLGHDVGRAFVRLCAELGVPLNAALEQLFTVKLPRREEVLQVVTGVDGDAAGGRGAVAKYYAVFRRDAEASVREVLEAAAIDALPPNVDLSRVYILGVELDRTGVADVKLYYQLERERLPRVVANFAELAPLMASTRSVVFQQCLKAPQKRQLYLHFDSHRALGAWVEQRPALKPMLARGAEVSRGLTGAELQPWIIAFRMSGPRVELDRSNLYFHLRPVPGAQAPAVKRQAQGPLEWMQRGDVVTDYTLVPYQPVAQLDGKLRSVNALAETFAFEGVEPEGRALIELLRTGLGPFRTVWGVKVKPPAQVAGWELYFYDQQRVHADLSVEQVKQLVAPALTIGADVPPDVPWHMFSVELGVPHLRERKPAAVDLYVSNNPFVKGTDRSYKVTGSTMELENVYSFHHPQTDVDEWLYRLSRGVHWDSKRVPLSALVPPELFSVGHLCVANKRRADALYFSRLTHGQLLFALKFYGVSGALPEYLAAAGPRFEHLLWDIGVDFVAREGGVQFTKVGVYGSF